MSGTMMTQGEVQATEKPDLNAPLHFNIDLIAIPQALRLVRADFNPNFNHEVGRVKQLYAALISEQMVLRTRAQSVVRPAEPDKDVPAQRYWEKCQEQARCASIAITNLETSCMYAIKALTA